MTIHSVREKLQRNKEWMYMRRFAAVTALAASFLCGCQEQPPVDGASQNISYESSQKFISASFEEYFQESFSVGGMEISAAEGLYCEIPVQSGETAAAAQGDYPALVLVDGILYKDTGRISTELRCGMLDGEITSMVDAVPAEDDQSNFGTGYGYQYGMNGVEVLIDGEWHIFEPYIDESKRE